MSLLPKVGVAALLAALALSPLLGGTPVGYQYALGAYGGDTMLGALRALLLVAAVCLFAADDRRHEAPRLARVSQGALRAGFTWTLVSLLVHSRFLSSPVLLFLTLPDALNWLCYALAFSLALRLAGDKRAALWMVVALAVGAAFSAVLGALAYGSSPDRATFRNSATFSSPNFAAGFFALVLPAAVALFVAQARTLLATVAGGAACALIFGVLVSTGSRAGVALALVGLVIALVLALVASRQEKAPLAWGRVGALLALLLLMGVAFRAPLLQRREAGAAASNASSGAFRRETWKGTLAMAKANPVLGTGPGTFPVLYPPYATVGWTGHAHSSYLQVAGEQGFPALAAYVLALAAAFAAGVVAVFAPRRGEEEDALARRRDPFAPAAASVSPVLLCGLIGGLVAGAGRSLFDSEWAQLGNGLPFWAVTGLVAGWGGTLVPASAGAAKASPLRFAAAGGAAVGLVLVLVLRAGNATRDGLLTAGTARGPVDPAVAASVWPPDPQLFALAGRPEDAARVEPSGKRFFQLARAAERTGDDRRAVEQFRRSLAAEPNNLQARKSLAEAQARAGDEAGALETWRALVDLSRGPAGRVRAIPELPDTLPAFGMAALGDRAAADGDHAEAERLFHDAQTLLEDYSRTPRAYQITELVTLANPEERRAETRALYQRVVEGRREALRRLNRPDEAAALDAAERETLARLDAFVKPEEVGTPAGGR